MISETDRKKIESIARKYNVTEVILFGSVAESEVSDDIHLAVKGLDKRFFFKFYAELYKNLSKPVDLIDLSVKSLFNDLIEKNGITIYG